MLGPVLRGRQISLEPAALDDLPLYQAWRVDPDVLRFMHYRFIGSVQEEEEWYRDVVRSEREVVWSVRLEGRTIGRTDLGIFWTSRSATSELILGDSSTWGRGFGSEAVRLRTRYAFQELGLERLEATSLAGNVAMHRALEKSGYRRAGIRHRYIFGGGVWHDAYVFELLRSEWERSAAPIPP
jgi:RimJ/RimL family protein N-acetyltransferase